MSNTLRNAAHAAYLRAAANGAEDPWIEVAEAVVKADRKRSWPEPWNSNRKHHAVIEAAKAQRRVLRHKPSIHSSDAVIAAWNQRVRETTDA